MKKKIISLVCFLAVCLSACGGNTFRTSAELAGALAEQYKVTGNMEEIGRITKDGALLLIGAVYYADGKVLAYYAAEFSEEKDGQYKFEHKVAIAQGFQLGFGKWKDGYAIVSNHADVSTIHFALSANGKHEEGDLEVGEVPFVYFLSLPDFDMESNYSMQISWLDSEGNEIL